MGFVLISEEKGRIVMDKSTLNKRKDLAAWMLSELNCIYANLEQTALEVEGSSDKYFDEAFREKEEELRSVLNTYHSNIGAIRELNNEITSLVNSWYDFLRDEKETGSLFFPFAFFAKKKMLINKIRAINARITEMTINNRFIKEKLTVLGHQLEIRALSLARSGERYLVYERLLADQNDIISDLKYLLPTIPGACPADISAAGIDAAIAVFKNQTEY